MDIGIKLMVTSESKTFKAVLLFRRSLNDQIWNWACLWLQMFPTVLWNRGFPSRETSTQLISIRISCWVGIDNFDTGMIAFFALLPHSFSFVVVRTKILPLWDWHSVTWVILHWLEYLHALSMNIIDPAREEYNMHIYCCHVDNVTKACCSKHDRRRNKQTAP